MTHPKDALTNDFQISPAHVTAEACYAFGMRYSAGHGVPPDLVTAHKWLNISVARGYAPAAVRRAELAREMSAAQIAAAQREARLWLTCH